MLNHMLLEVCAATAQYQERFAQTSTGWVLRELSPAEQERVIGFIEQHIACFSSEGLIYATEKLPPDVKQRLSENHSQRARR